MEIGVIVIYERERWRVLKADSHVKTVTLARWGGETREVADDDPGMTLVAKPSTWPVVTTPVKPTAGPLVRISLNRGAAQHRALTPMVEWVPSDPYRSGGSVFLNPRLGLKVGETLLAEYGDGSTTRIVIGKGYGSMAQRKARLEPVKEEPKTIFEVLEGEEFVD